MIMLLNLQSKSTRTVNYLQKCCIIYFCIRQWKAFFVSWDIRYIFVQVYYYIIYSHASWLL